MGRASQENSVHAHVDDWLISGECYKQEMGRSFEAMPWEYRVE
jgi:hypothetical protein